MPAVLNGLFLPDDGSDTIHIYDAPAATEQITLAHQWMRQWAGTLVVWSFNDQVFDSLFSRLYFAHRIVIERTCPPENARRILNTKFSFMTKLVVKCDVTVEDLQRFVSINFVLSLTCRYMSNLFDELGFVQDLRVTTVCRHQITSCPKLDTLHVSVSSRFDCTPSFYVFAEKVRALHIKGKFGSNTRGLRPTRCQYLEARVDYQMFHRDFVRSLSVPYLHLVLPHVRVWRKPDFSQLVARRLRLDPAISMIPPRKCDEVVLYDWTPDVDLGQTVLGTVAVDCDNVFVPEAFQIKCRHLRLRCEHLLHQLPHGEHNPHYNEPPTLLERIHDANSAEWVFKRRCAAKIAVRTFSEWFDEDGDHAVRVQILSLLM